MRALFVLLAIIAISFAGVACDDGDGSLTLTTPGTTPGTSSRTPGPPTEGPTAEPTFQGGARTPVEGSVGGPPGTPPPVPQLIAVRSDRHIDYDRAVFEFDGPVNYRVEYVPQAVQCASGEPALVTGPALLQVRFTPAQAHDDQGESTVPRTDIILDQPVILNMVQTCDFEGEVTWVLGLIQENDFAVTALEDPLRLAIDVAQPAIPPTPLPGIFP